MGNANPDPGCHGTGPIVLFCYVDGAAALGLTMANTVEVSWTRRDVAVDFKTSAARGLEVRLGGSPVGSCVADCIPPDMYVVDSRSLGVLMYLTIPTDGTSNSPGKKKCERLRNDLE